MKQVHAHMDDDLVGHLDRISTARGISWPELMRRLSRELVSADAEGRELFTQSVEQISAKDVAQIVVELREQNMNLDRLLRSADKREAELRKTMLAYENDAAAARERGTRALREDIAAQLEPIIRENTRQRDGLAALFDKRLLAIEENSRRPRKDVKLSFPIGKALTPWQVIGVGLLILLASIGVFYGAAKILPKGWIAVRAANDLLGGGDQAICALVNYRFEANDCHLTDRGVKALIPNEPAPTLKGGKR